MFSPTHEYILKAKDLQFLLKQMTKKNSNKDLGYNLTDLKALLDVNQWEALRVYPESKSISVSHDLAMLHLAYDKNFEDIQVPLSFYWITKTFYNKGVSLYRQIATYLEKEGFAFHDWIAQNLLHHTVRYDLLQEYASNLVSKSYVPEREGVLLAYHVLEYHNRHKDKYIQTFLLDMLKFCCDNIDKLDKNLIQQEVVRFAKNHQSISNKAYWRYEQLVKSLDRKDFENYMEKNKFLEEFFNLNAPGVKKTQVNHVYDYVFNVSNMSRETLAPMNKLSMGLNVLAQVLRDELGENVEWRYSRKVGQLSVYLTQEKEQSYIISYIEQMLEYIKEHKAFFDDAKTIFQKHKLEHTLSERGATRKLNKI